jgi:hypothetical protein
MFTGPGGRKAVDDALSHLQATGLPSDEQRALGTMLHSVQTYYNQQGTAAPTSAQAPGLTMPYSTR